MPELGEYEITEKNGMVTTVQLTEEDAKKVPHAKRIGTVHVEETSDDEPTTTTTTTGTTTGEHEHEPVSNRARKSG